VAGKIVADIIEAPAGRISLNVANVTVASINASGLYTSTGNLLITQANSIGTDAIEDGAVTDAKLTLAANASNIKTALNASGDAPVYACRAWVNFNGTTSPGTIRASGNVSSVARNGTGDYTVNFTTAMPDADYAVIGTARRGAVNNNMIFRLPLDGTYSTSAVQVNVAAHTDGTILNGDIVNVAIFR
jgi:hypothetical protein